MRGFGLLFALGITGLSFVPLAGTQTPTQPPAAAVAAKPADVKPEPLPELLALKISLLQSEAEKAGLIVEASEPVKAYRAKLKDLGDQMDALLTPYQKAHHCTIDQIAKTCVPTPKDDK